MRRSQISEAGWYHGYTGFVHPSDSGLYASLAATEKAVWQRGYDDGFRNAKFWLHDGFIPSIAALQEVGKSLGDGRYNYHDEVYVVANGQVYWLSEPNEVEYKPLGGKQRKEFAKGTWF